MKDSAKFRFMPRFSLRLLLTLVALFAAYFACAAITKHQGKRDVQSLFPAGEFVFSIDVAYVAPLILSTTESSYDDSSDAFLLTTKYYFWFFGSVSSLPIQTQESRDGLEFLSSLIKEIQDTSSQSEE